MNNFIKNLIVILILTNLISQIISKKNQTDIDNEIGTDYDFSIFECDANTKLDLDVLSLLIDKDSNIYFETKFYLIKFRPPAIVDDKKNIYSATQMELKTKIHDEHGKRIGLKFEGEFVGTKAITFKLKEVHNLRSSIMETDVIFENDAPKRINSTSITNKNPENIKDFKYKYKYLDTEQDLMIDFKYDKKSSKSTLLSIDSYETDPKTTYKNDVHYSGEMQLPYAIEHSIFYLNAVDKNFANILIDIDEDKKIHLIKFLFPKYILERHYDQFSNITVNDHLLHFLSCHLPFKRREHVKGILFKNETFFIFIDRFYLSINDDLMSNGFKLYNNYYLSNAKNVEIQQSKFSRDLQYASSNKIDKLVKLWDENLYLIDDYLFKLNTFKNNDNDSKILIRTELEKFYKENVSLTTLPARLRKCHGQFYSFEFEDKHLVYCFFNTHYYLFLRGVKNVHSLVYEYYEEPNSPLHQIKNLFKNADFQFEDNQIFQQFFDYKFNKICLFTQDHLYCIDKNLDPNKVNEKNFEFHFKKSDVKYDPFNIKDLDKVGLFKFKSYLFEGADDKIDLESKKNQLLFMIIFGLISFITLILLSLLLFKLSKSKSSFKNTLLIIKKSSAKNMNLMVNKLKQLKSATAKLATKKSSEKEIKKSASQDLKKSSSKDLKKSSSKDLKKSASKDLKKSSSKDLKKSSSKDLKKSASKDLKKSASKSEDLKSTKSKDSVKSIGQFKEFEKSKSSSSIGAGSKMDKKVDKIKSDSKGQIRKTSPSKKSIGKAQSLSKSISKESSSPLNASTTSQKAANKKDSKSKTPKK